MSPAEVAHRGSVAVRAQARRRLGRERLSGIVPAQLSEGARWLQVPQGVDPAPYVDEALAVAAGSVRLFAHRRFDVGPEPDWNRCPLLGVSCPPMPSHGVNVADTAVVGDIKYVWELNRHLHWVALAQAWALTRDAQHLEVLGRQLTSWLDQCPHGQGPNWTSSLEFALRLLSWAQVWQLIGGAAAPLFEGAAGEQLRARWLASVHVHVRAIARNYSRHSSANNHLLGELAGVFVASCVWPLWSDVERLGRRAREELEAEVLLQVCGDGVLREQAFEYASFAFDLLLVVLLAAEASGQPMSTIYLNRMLGLCGFVRSVRTASGAVPMVGDGDGAEAWRLDPRIGRCPFATMLRREDWLRGGPEARSELEPWLLPLAAGGAPSSPPQAPGLDFMEGGYHLFRAEGGTNREVLGFVDAGPLGYLGIAAHGHADALQLWLALGGNPLLIDPGTYAYGVPIEWREYFRGTSAHNTVCIGGLSQSVSGGRFMWTRKANTQVMDLQRDDAGGLSLQARHDGYRRLQGFEHERTVSFKSEQASLEVRDLVQGQGEELIQLHWHVAPDWEVEQTGEVSALLSRPGIRVRLTIEADVAGALSLHRGEQEPPLGWYSPAYCEKQPCTVLRWQGRAAGAQLRTRIAWEFGGESGQGY